MPSWPEKAACAGMATFIDFTADRPDPYTERAALAICGYCQVKEQCLASAKADPFASGVYGGQVIRTSEQARKHAEYQARLAPHGTVTRYRRHLKHDQTPCADCARVYNDYQRQRKGRAS